VQEFSLGGEADSAYEYFIKEHILLGGAKEQYKNLYVKSVETAENHLFFTPFVEGDPDILFSGKFKSQYEDDGSQGPGELYGEMQHLVKDLFNEANHRLALLAACLHWDRESSIVHMTWSLLERLQMAAWYQTHPDTI
jgi:hypothetical protein